MYILTNMSFHEYLTEHLGKIVGETLYLVGVSALIAIIFGIILGSLLFWLSNGKSKTTHILYRIFDIIINIFRSFPFIILIIFVIPFTRHVMKLFTGIGTSSGNTAALVPLSIAAIPFFTKIIENALVEVPKDTIEAAVSLGLNKFQIICKVVLREALPAIILGLTLAIISLVGFSAMAGSVGAGGIGNFAIIYGQNNYDNNALWFGVITVIILVQLIQLVGTSIYKLIK